MTDKLSHDLNGHLKNYWSFNIFFNVIWEGSSDRRLSLIQSYQQCETQNNKKLQVRIPLSTDKEMQKRYLNVAGMVRIGKVLEVRRLLGNLIWKNYLTT